MVCRSIGRGWWWRGTCCVAQQGRWPGAFWSAACSGWSRASRPACWARPRCWRLQAWAGCPAWRRACRLLRAGRRWGVTGGVYGAVYSGVDLGFCLAAPVFGALLDRGLSAGIFHGAALVLVLGVVSAALVGAG